MMTEAAPSDVTATAGRPSILIVDDDRLLLRAVERSLGLRFDVSTAGSAEEALRLVDRPASFEVVVCDLRLPGRSGLHLLQELRASHPDTVRVLISGEAQLRDAVTAVNEGQVFRLLTKPFKASEFTATVVAASEQHRLLMSERVLLEQTLHGSLKALADMLAIVQPAAFGRAERLRRHTSELAEKSGVTRRWDMEIAALLSQVGCVTLDAGTLDRWYHSQGLTPVEQAQIARLPKFAEDLLAGIPRMETVRAILRRQYEPPNAPGIPVGATILAIARDFDLLIGQGESAEHALATMEGRRDRYDVELLRAFRAIRGELAPSATILETRLMNVREGMTFAADIHSPTGMLLIARGQRVSAALMERIRTQWSEFASTTEVRVIVPAAPAAVS